MTSALTTRYEFERLPLNPIEPGTNILVSGSSLDGARRLVFELLADNDSREGVMVMSADLDATSAVEEYERAGSAFDPARMCVLDCTQQGSENDGPLRQVGSPADLTGIGIEFSSLYESLLSRDYPYARIGLCSISTLLVFADDFRPVYRFLHTLTSRIRTSDGLGICEIDPEATDKQAYGTVAQAFDARIDVRSGEDGPEMRVQGLDDQPREWQPLPW